MIIRIGINRGGLGHDRVSSKKEYDIKRGEEENIEPIRQFFYLKDTSMKISRKWKRCREEILEDAVGRLQGKHKPY